MGWNSLRILRDDPLFRYVEDGEYVYYVHSYYARDCRPSTLAVSRYGDVDVTGAVAGGTSGAPSSTRRSPGTRGCGC